MSDKYISRAGGVVEPCIDINEWGRWYGADHDLAFEAGGRRIGFDELPGGVRVSTVFLGLDHAHGGGPPLLFETMIFRDPGGWSEDYCERYTTAAEALAGHARAVELARQPAESPT